MSHPVPGMAGLFLPFWPLLGDFAISLLRQHLKYVPSLILLIIIYQCFTTILILHFCLEDLYLNSASNICSNPLSQGLALVTSPFIRNEVLTLREPLSFPALFSCVE